MITEDMFEFTGEMKLGPFVLGPDGPNYGIYEGDCRDLGNSVPDHSVDLIFTDPPWDGASFELYEWLGPWAKRVLTYNGWLFAYCGNDWLPDVLSVMSYAGLHYFRTFCGVQLNSNDIYPAKKLFVKWRPVVVFTGTGDPNGPRDHGYLPDATKTNRDKKWHQWGQGEDAVMRWMSAIVGDWDNIVVDPFCGGGTTCAVARQLGVKYLAFEKDPFAVEESRKRLAQKPGNLWSAASNAVATPRTFWSAETVLGQGADDEENG